MNRGNFALEGDEELKRNCCGLRGRGFDDFSREDLRDIILHKNKVIADLEKHAYSYGSASWIENLNRGLKKAKQIKDKVDKKPPKESEADFRKRLEDFDKERDAPTEEWGADELNGGVLTQAKVNAAGDTYRHLSENRDDLNAQVARFSLAQLTDLEEMIDYFLPSPAIGEDTKAFYLQLKPIITREIQAKTVEMARDSMSAREATGNGLFDDIAAALPSYQKEKKEAYDKLPEEEKRKLETERKRSIAAKRAEVIKEAEQKAIKYLDEDKDKPYYEKSLKVKLGNLTREQYIQNFKDKRAKSFDEAKGGAAAPTPTEPKISPVAAAAAALQPVRTAIQKGIGDAIYGKETDPRKQKKGLLGISEEGKEESQKKVMKNIVVPIMKAAISLGTTTKDIANMIFNPDKYDDDMTELRIKRLKAEEAKAGIVRDKTNPMIIIRKPRGFWTAETSDPKEEAYNQKRAAWRGADNVFYIRVPNPIFAAKLRPSFKEFSDARVKLWTGVQQNDPKRSEDVDGTLKSLHDDEFIFIPEDRAKEIYGSLRQFVADKQDEGVAKGFEDLGFTKGQLKAFAKIDPRTLKGQELIDWKEEKLLLDRQQTENALKKVNKDIKDEEAKATPDQTRMTKMREAKVRVEKREKDLVSRGQQEFQDRMMFQTAEKAKRDAEYYAQQQAAAAAQQTQQTEEASDAVKEQAQGSVDLLQQAQVVGGGTTSSKKNKVAPEPPSGPVSAVQYPIRNAVVGQVVGCSEADTAVILAALKLANKVGKDAIVSAGMRVPIVALKIEYTDNFKAAVRGTYLYEFFQYQTRGQDLVIYMSDVAAGNIVGRPPLDDIIREAANEVCLWTLNEIRRTGQNKVVVFDAIKRNIARVRLVTGNGMTGSAKPKDPALYEKAKAIVNKSYPKHSAYRSGAYVKKYKEMGGEYEDEPDGKRPLERWFKEDWKDVGNKEYPVYRPTKRISKDTPLTPDEIDPENLKLQVKEKQKIKGERNLSAFKKRGGADRDDDDTEDDEKEEIDIIRIDMGKGRVYLVDAPPKDEKGKLVGLPFSSFKAALSGPLGIGNRRVFDAETEEEVGRLRDPIYKKIAMKVYKMEEEWRQKNLKKLGVVMDEDEEELEGGRYKRRRQTTFDAYFQRSHRNPPPPDPDPTPTPSPPRRGPDDLPYPRTPPPPVDEPFMCAECRRIIQPGTRDYENRHDMFIEIVCGACHEEPEVEGDGMVGSGAVEYTLQKAGMRLFNPSGDRSKAGRQSFTPDYDAYGATVQEGRQNAFNLSRSMYDQSKAIELPDFKLMRDDTSLRFYRKEDEGVILVGIRGTDVKSWTDLYTWAVIGANQDLRMTTRFQEDLAKLVSFQRQYPPSQFYYVATGSSLAGSIADRFLELGLIEEAITYNPSIERKYVLDEGVLNHRVYLDTDPLFMLMGQYAPNTEIRVNPNKNNFYNPLKETDYLIASHLIYPIYNPAFEGGGMEGSGKTYTIEEWKAIFDAKLEQKRKAIEAREAKKKQTAKAKRERAKGRRDGRDEPKEPEPEAELEVTQFTIEGQIILVEDDDAGEKRFLDRRVFNDDSEEIGTLGSLTPEKLRKLVVERVQRAEKRGEFAPEVVFGEDEEDDDDDDDEPPPLEAPFRTSRVQKATPPKGEPKKRKPRFKVVAPASARVELREELVAEQPRTEKGKFAEEAETAVVAVSQAPQRAYMKLMKSPAFTVADRKLLTRIRETKMSPRMRAVLLGRSGLARKVMEMMGLDESAFQTQRGQLRIMDKVEKRVEKTRVREAIDPPASFRDEFRAIIDAHREMPSKEKAKIMKKLLPSVERYRKQHTQYERVGDRGAVRAILDRTYTEMKLQASLSAPLLKDELYRSQMTTWFDDVLHLEVRRDDEPIKLFYNELSPRGYRVYVSKMVRPNGQVFELSKFNKSFFEKKYEGRREVDSDWDKMRKEGDLTDGEKSFIGRLKERREVSKYGYDIAGGTLDRDDLRKFIEENYKFFTPREWCDDRVFDEWLGLPLFYTKPYQYWDDPWVGISDANPNGRKPTLYRRTEEKIKEEIGKVEKMWDFMYWRKIGGEGSLALWQMELEWNTGRKKGESSYDPLMRN